MEYKIYTSYYGNIDSIPAGIIKVGISNWMPSKTDAEHLEELAPPRPLLEMYEEGLINAEEYTILYTEDILDKLDPKEIAEKVNNSVMLCWEQPPRFCHRRVVAKWLEDNLNIVVEELSEKKLAVNAIKQNKKTKERTMSSQELQAVRENIIPKEKTVSNRELQTIKNIVNGN